MLLNLPLCIDQPTGIYMAQVTVALRLGHPGVKEPPGWGSTPALATVGSH